MNKYYPTRNTLSLLRLVRRTFRHIKGKQQLLYFYSHKKLHLFYYRKEMNINTFIYQYKSRNKKIIFTFENSVPYIPLQIA